MKPFLVSILSPLSPSLLSQHFCFLSHFILFLIPRSSCKWMESFLVLGFLCYSQSSFSSFFLFHTHFLLLSPFFLFFPPPLYFSLPTLSPILSLQFWFFYLLFCLFSLVSHLDDSSCLSTSLKLESCSFSLSDFCLLEHGAWGIV